MNRGTQSALIAIVLLCAGAARADEVAEQGAAVARAEAGLKAAADRLALVEAEYIRAEDPTELLQLKKRFADGETQYLLGEYANAAALLWDVVDSPLYQKEESHPDAVYYLADSLYRTGAWLEARRYYRQIFADKITRRMGEALLRLFDLSDKLQDYTGIQGLWEELQASGGARVRADVSYAHAKWLSRRPDLPDEARIPAALASFNAIADTSEYGPQARYFEGVLLVQRGALDEAARRYQALLNLPALNEEPPKTETKPKPGELPRPVKMARLRDLTRLALGRIYFEQAKFSQAIDSYDLVPRESEYFNDALYELSATWLKLGENERALRATELLLLLVEDSPIAPEARLQEANLYLKLKKYPKAISQFEDVAARYRPVRERIDALVKLDDPVSYYDELLKRGQQTLDATQLLPEVARKYATGGDVGHARLIIGELADGEKGIGESREILKRLQAAVDAGKLELFPTLQEGNSRAVEVENALLRIEGDLASVISRLVAAAPPQAQVALKAAQAERAQLEARMHALPETQAALEERQKRYAARISELEKLAFRLGYDIDAINAQLDAAEKWRQGSEARRKDLPAEEQAFQKTIERDKLVVAQLEEERQQTLRLIAVAQAQTQSAAAGGEAEERLRAEYTKAAQREVAAAQSALAALSPEHRKLGARVEALGDSLRVLRGRALAVRQSVRTRAAQKLLSLRDRVEREAESVRGQGDEAQKVAGNTKQLVGKIAFNSFQRVGRQFYDLVLKADVGLIDAAWIQKKEKTDSITTVDEEKRAALKDLANRFSEALKVAE